MKPLHRNLLVGGGVLLGLLLLSSTASAPSGQVPAVKTPLSHAQAIAFLKAALQQKLGRAPSTAELKMLVAQSALETANWQKIYNNNFGNITTSSSPWYTLGAELLVGAHHYRPYTTPAEGAAALVSLLARRYPEAWALLGSGDTTAFSAALKSHGYYEGDPKKTPEQQIATYASGLDSRYALA